MKKHEASMAIQVLPSVPDDSELVRIVDKVIEYIKGTGLSHFVGPFETTIEGDFDALFDIAKQCQLICIREGAPGVISYMKLFYNPSEGVMTIDEKITKHNSV